MLHFLKFVIVRHYIFFLFRGSRKCLNVCGPNPKAKLLRGRIDILFDMNSNITITDLKMVLFYQYECETGEPLSFFPFLDNLTMLLQKVKITFFFI